MIRHILFPFDFSEQGRRAAASVRAIAGRSGARVTVLSVVPPVFDAMPVEMGDRAGDTVAGWKAALAARLHQALVMELNGLIVDRVSDAGDPAFRITDFAHREHVDLIMMPTHGLGRFRHLLLGSVTSKVLHDARCPVWTAAHVDNGVSPDLPGKILCAFDGGTASAVVLRWADEFSAQVGASLQLLHVVTPISDWPELDRERALQEQVRDTAERRVRCLLHSTGVRAPSRVAVGGIAETVAAQAAESDAGLVIIGRGSLQSPLGRLRTHAYAIARQSPCPVLSV